MIEVTGLRKTFGELTAVDEVSFTVQPGEIFGLLGPNGAGKTTTISCLSGLLKPTAGTIRIAGHDLRAEALAARAALGLVPQEIALYQEVSARENLHYWGGLYGLRGNELAQRIDELLELTGLLDRAAEPVNRFSGGMKRRLNLACGIIHRPGVLLLDEPTVGVDPQSRVHLLELVAEQADSGVTVLYTTHYMEEAQQLCDRVAIIDAGRILVAGTLDELRQETDERDLIRLTGDFPLPTTVDAVRSALPQAEVMESGGDELVITLPDAAERLGDLLGVVQGAGGVLRETTVREPSLETLFIKLTGKALRE